MLLRCQQFLMTINSWNCIMWVVSRCGSFYVTTKDNLACQVGLSQLDGKLPAVTSTGTISWVPCSKYLHFYRGDNRVEYWAVYSAGSREGKALRRAMARAYVPAAKIPAAITSSNILERFRLYLQETWLTTWTPDSWSVYRQGLRTNNDTEGWHRRFNSIAATRGAPDLYSLINLLGREASIISAQIKLISKEKMRKRQKMNDNGLWKFWDCYDLKNITTSELLRRARKFSSIL